MIVALAIPFTVLGAAIFLRLFTHTISAHSGASVDAKASGGFWGAYFSWLTNNPLTRTLDRGIDWVLKNARGWVSHWSVAAAKPIARWFDGLTELSQRTAQEHAALAVDTADGFAGMRYGVIPRALAKALHQPVKDIKAASRTANTAAAHTAALSKTVATTHRAQVRLNVHYTHAIDVALPRDIARIRTAEEKLSRDQAALRERTTSLENGALKTFEWITAHPLSLVTGVFASAVAIALQRLGFGFLRCRSWRSLGRNLTCGMASLLEDLLFAAVTAFAVTDICDFADAAETLAQEFAPVLMALVDVENALVGCHGATAPPDLSYGRLYLPPSNLGLALAG